MTTSRRFLLLLPIVALLAAPAVAIGCSIAVERPTRPHIAADDLRFMHHHRGTRAAWVRGAGWESSRVALIQPIHPRFMRRPVTAAFAQQRTLRMIAMRPSDGVYTEGADPATNCALVGRRVYSQTRLLVRETPRAIFITLASHRTLGSTTGCDVQHTSCDDLVLRNVRLQAPISKRQLYAVTFRD